MVSKPGHGHGQPLGEAWVVDGLPAGQLIEFQARDRDRRRGEDVRAAEIAHVFQPHFRSFWSVIRFQYLAWAGPMAGALASRSNSHPAGSRCSLTSNSVIGSASEAACTTVAFCASTTLTTPLPSTSNEFSLTQIAVFSSIPTPSLSGSSATALRSRGSRPRSPKCMSISILGTSPRPGPVLTVAVDTSPP